MKKVWYWLVLFVESVLCSFYFRVLNRVDIKGAIPKPEDGPVIYYMNHPNGIEPVLTLFGCFLKPLDFFLNRNPKVWTVAWADNPKPWWMIRWIMRPARVLEYSGLMRDLEGLVARCLDILRRGEQLQICPEGAIHGGAQADDLAKFGRLIAFLIERCDARVAAVALLGTKSLWPARSLPRIGNHIRVVVSEPTPASFWKGKSRPEIVADLSGRLQKILRAHA